MGRGHTSAQNVRTGEAPTPDGSLHIEHNRRPSRDRPIIMQISSIRARASRHVAWAALAALVPLLFAACGGGGGSSSPPPPVSPGTVLVYGTAATGAGIAGTVSIEDSAGHVTSLPVTADSGAFSASVSGMVAPFMLKVVSTDGATVLYSAVDQPGRANINPLTSLALLRIAAARGQHGPADLYAAPASFGSWLVTANLADASAKMLSRLMPAFVADLPGASSAAATAPTFDPFATPWTVGSAVDQLLDSYPVVFSTDGAGIVTAVQTEQASGLAIEAGRSDTAASGATQLSITGAGQGTIVGGSAMQFGAQASFQGGAQQAVAASWQVTGLAGVSVQSNGKVSIPAVDAATTITVTAYFFDGSTTTAASQSMTVVPAMRPTGIDISGAPDNSTLAAGASLALGASVHWSDGSSTTPAVTWSFTGDATAVAQLGADGLLRAGKPVSDAPIQVTATFSQGGIPVSAQLSLTVSHFVRRVQSVSLSGLVGGQVLTAGDHVGLALTASWNDGSESTLTALGWGTAPAPGAVNRIGTSVSPVGLLSTSVLYVPASADDSARAPESDVLHVSYDNGDGSVGQLSVAFAVKPLVNIPVALEIRGVTAMNELDTASFQVFVDYEDGSSEPADVTLTSQDPTLLAPSLSAGSFTAAAYSSKPATNLVARLSGSRGYTYEDVDGQWHTTTLTATQAVTIAWKDPALVEMTVPVDHLAVGVATPVAVTGRYVKFGVQSYAPVTNASFSVDSALVTVDGNTLTAAQPPSTVDASWVTLTTTAYDPGAGANVTLSRLVTVDLPDTVPKRLLAYPWSPDDDAVQFRAIASNGQVDDYTVTRTLPDYLSYASPAARHPLRLLSGATDFTQSRMNPDLPVGAVQETQYIAAVERGRVLVLRHDDMTFTNGTARPVVLGDVTNALRVALVARADGGSGPAAVRLYVLDQLGTVRQYTLPYAADQPIAAADVQFERQLAGSYSQMSAGADFILLRSTSGGAWAEGAGESEALGDPLGASHWNDTFAMQYDSCPVTCAFAPFTRVTQVHADVDRSFVARSDAVALWGANETQFWSSYATSVGPDIGVSSLASYAWIQGDGSVHYRNLAFVGEGALWPNDIGVGSTRFFAVATWLPPALEIVDGRRPASGPWPIPGIPEYELMPAMPIVRTTTDALYYLDGRPILDPLGNPIVLP